ncbi:SH3 domain-containing protein [Bacillus sp. SCS-151]|uniref:SH3 domain-containing protein n=1 Tax=Nanhaiella sioensis TaxID=3115293 RepID=UPI00397CFA81
MYYIVARSHKTNYPKPITLMKGQAIIVSEKREGYWIYCKTTDEAMEGWVPESLIKIDGNTAFASENYTARELNIDVNEKVIGIKELYGWLWCRNVSNDEEGWVPIDHLKPIV